jgi:mitotic spindle assembly checkpoint protein MAD1
VLCFFALPTDPQTATAKRQQRAQAFTSHMAHAALERQLATAETARVDLETRLREKELHAEQLERDRRWLAEREEKERSEKERERKEHEAVKVGFALRPRTIYM